MKIKNLFYLIFLLIVAMLPNSFAQDNTQVGLPEGAIARLGKGGINIMRFSPDGTHLAVVSAGNITTTWRKLKRFNSITFKLNYNRRTINPTI